MPQLRIRPQFRVNMFLRFETLDLLSYFFSHRNPKQQPIDSKGKHTPNLGCLRLWGRFSCVQLELNSRRSDSSRRGSCRGCCAANTFINLRRACLSMAAAVLCSALPYTLIRHRRDVTALLARYLHASHLLPDAMLTYTNSALLHDFSSRIVAITNTTEHPCDSNSVADWLKLYYHVEGDSDADEGFPTRGEWNTTHVK